MDTLALESRTAAPHLDFRVGRLCLVRHFGLEARKGDRSSIPRTCVLDTTEASTYASQLLLRDVSAFPHDRAPLFVCGCGDLGCGALTVAVSFDGSHATWSEFGWQGPGAETFSADDFMARTGPFTFDRANYEGLLLPFVSGRSQGRKTS